MVGITVGARDWINVIATRPQHPVAGRAQDPFKLYDFPLVSPTGLLY
jgi:hypothetical protein